jgi:hypothetical protein
MTSPRFTAAPHLAAIAIVLGIPCLYFLSVGPAFWLVYHGFISHDIYSVYVAPASMVTPPDSPQAHLVIWYLSFFAPVTG